ncbi:FMN-binding glutamate synthase family protein [Limnohabitans sp. T6-20]|uniref:FMN-binding glutamate synthase family protein n=1 Tax=Limnohabitans sp. T6-20 TaxID=1100725 RepID=UPI000D36C8CC|nr:FMN-binding glutamate synthase family protein [Limnohabitans sp. T6-20]PUE10163.1 FMN-binding glutamate synthase family protein [Limnohabitans sp. T6-20]
MARQSLSRYLPWLITVPAAVVSTPFSVWASAGFAVLFVLGWIDFTQSKQAVRRNYPLTGRLRYGLEYIRPEMRQYFLEDDEQKLPFSRNQRAMVYARSKVQNDKRGFGSIKDMYNPNTEWIAHSLQPEQPDPASFRIRVGGTQCTQAYDLSLLNISGMSFGALSPNAVKALNKGAARGQFAHDTGEGSISAHHREHGGDLIWQIASGYFGCRTQDGHFDPERFALQAQSPQVKMIEVKLSQGAKPGHGGVLPKAKVSAEIADARGVPMGQDCVSPAKHSAFTTPVELLKFVAQLRQLSGGKPVGIKLCVGHPAEWFSLVKAMVQTGQTPDFVVVDGAEGGTGAAPIEFADHVGMPLRDGLRLVHNSLVGAGLRERIKIGASGKVISAFDIARCLALGADWCNSARGFMFALGCIQSRSCHTDHCPTGVATQDPVRQRAIVVTDKAERVYYFHANTMHALADLLGAAGLTRPADMTAHHLMVRNAQGQARSLASTIDTLLPGQLLQAPADPAALPSPFAEFWQASDAHRWGLTPA